MENFCIREGGGDVDAVPCPDPNKGATPFLDESKMPRVPGQSVSQLKEVCPYLDGKDVCCNGDQIAMMCKEILIYQTR